MLAGVEAELMTVLLGQPFVFVALVAIGAGVFPLEVEPDPEPELVFDPQAVSTNASAVASEMINQNDFLLPK
jgi:hypothetical protein